MRKRKDIIFDPVPIPDEELAYGLRFTGADLAANRAGQLSERQTLGLRKLIKRFWIDAIIACVCMVGCLGIWGIIIG